MRIRRKKHLYERLDKVNDYLIIADKSVINVNDAIKDKKLIDFNKVFRNNKPICLEIGCGKGAFICKKAVKDNKNNYIAVEMIENIILSATEKAKTNNIDNVRFMNTGAEYLPRYIKDNSISEIYLNFSPPFPPNNRENKRLTNDRFLQVYKDILIENGVIYQKTDDKAFYDYSFKHFVKNGYYTTDQTDNVLSGKVDNITTEYEEKFISKGVPIYYLKAIVKK